MPGSTAIIPVIVVRALRRNSRRQGLLNQFTKDEILDLLAYLESMGKEKGPNFKPVAKAEESVPQALTGHKQAKQKQVQGKRR